MLTLFAIMKPTTVLLALATVLCLAGLTNGQSSICVGNVCLSCPDCSSISPSYTYIGNSVPTVADLKKSCVCYGCPIFTNTECVATDAKTSEILPDSTTVPIGNGISTSDLPSSVGTTSSSGSQGGSSGIFYECPAGCTDISYTPVIYGEIAVEDILSTGCDCSGCPGDPFPECKLYKDGKELSPEVILSATEAINAQRIDTTGSSSVLTDGSQLISGVILAIVMASLCLVA